MDMKEMLRRRRVFNKAMSKLTKLSKNQVLPKVSLCREKLVELLEGEKVRYSLDDSTRKFVEHHIQKCDEIIESCGDDVYISSFMTIFYYTINYTYNKHTGRNIFYPEKDVTNNEKNSVLIGI